MEKTDGSISSMGISQTLVLPGPEDAELNELVTKVKNFRGLVCIVELEGGKILHANQRVQFLKGIEKGSSVNEVFFHSVPQRERERVMKQFLEIHRSGQGGRYTLPVIVGQYEIQLEVELIKFSRGIVLKVPDEVLIRVKEMELEKLKLLLLKYSHMGLWVTDEKGEIVDILKTNCLENLGWSDAEVIGKNIARFSMGERSSGGEEYRISRPCKGGSLRKAEVVEGKVRLSNGRHYFIYIDNYL